MKQMAGVKEAVVLVTGEAEGEKQLIGFVVPQDDERSDLFEVKFADADAARYCRQELAAAEQLQSMKLMAAVDAEATAAFLQELDNAGMYAIRAALTAFGLYKREGSTIRSMS